MRRVLVVLESMRHVVEALEGIRHVLKLLTMLVMPALLVSLVAGTALSALLFLGFNRLKACERYLPGERQPVAL